MVSYQEQILGTLEARANTVSLNPHAGDMRSILTTRQMEYANCGRLIASHPADLRTLATVDFDFQTYKVHASINESAKPGHPAIGPRREGIYHWTPGGGGDDDTELARFLDHWVLFLRRGVIDTLEGMDQRHALVYWGGSDV